MNYKKEAITPFLYMQFYLKVLYFQRKNIKNILFRWL